MPVLQVYISDATQNALSLISQFREGKSKFIQAAIKDKIESFLEGADGNIKSKIKDELKKDIKAEEIVIVKKKTIAGKTSLKRHDAT